MDTIEALRTFVRVVETGSLTAVAREMNASQSTISRHINQLEEHFGVRLLHRTTRHLSLTDDGIGLARNDRGAFRIRDGSGDVSRCNDSGYQKRVGGRGGHRPRTRSESSDR